MPVSRQQEQGLVQTSAFQIFWGGPDRPPRFLRDVLEERIHAVPTGGEIFWITYYFRDESLAQALLKAHRRGVRVRVVMEGSPRTGAVNNRVKKILEGDASLGEGLRVLRHRLVDNRFLRRSRLHEKLYYFSHPVPSTLMGTFNPSGNVPEDPAVIRKIGDQDRGHNVLVDIRDPSLVQGLLAHAQNIFEMRHGPWERFLPESNRVLTSGKTRILFFPRAWRKDFNGLFEDLGSGDRLRMAVSHLNDQAVCKRLFRLARLGVHVEILAHDTQRRVPSWVEKQMLANRIGFHRYIHPEGLPMHNKFMLIDMPVRRLLTVGSMNLSVRSLHANHELLMIAENHDLYDAFEQRWNEMMEEVRSQRRQADSPSA